ncbi:MAG: hypothetical protein IPJ88_08265 [Myxococcales bacterium]|nr:MAG: hypothetical protein IPJ88_08265 [Myxococcales bacterium]
MDKKLSLYLMLLAACSYCNLDRAASAGSIDDSDASVYDGPNFQAAFAGVDAEVDAALPSAQSSALLLINEVNANISSGCDLVELRVIRSGEIKDFVFKERGSTAYVFDNLFVKKGDFILLHFDASDSKCNPNTLDSEYNDPMQYPEEQNPMNRDSAYDMYLDDTGLVATDNVLSLYDASLEFIDAVLISDAPTGNAASASEKQAALVANAHEWLSEDLDIPNEGFVDESFNLNAVHDSKHSSVTMQGPSIQRKRDLDENHRGDWYEATEMPEQTWGIDNPGQTPLTSE